MRMTARKRFGSVRVRLDELENGVLDFSKRLKASAPQRTEPELDTAARAAESSAGRAADALPPSLKSDGIEGDEMSDGEDASWGGARKPQKGRRDIFGSIIAKWSNISAPDGGAADSDEEGGGGALSDDDADDQDSDDYEYDDDMIDNSELEQKFVSKVTAKQKHKKTKSAGAGFRIENKADDDEGDEEEDEEDEEDEECGSEKEGEDDTMVGEAENGGGGGSRKIMDAKTGLPRDKKAGGGAGPKRRRRRQWLRDGDRYFKEVPEVAKCVADKLGASGEKLSNGLDKEALQAVVHVFEAAEQHNCAADKLLEWLATKLDFKAVQSIEGKIKKAFQQHKAATQQQHWLDQLHPFISQAAATGTIVQPDSDTDHAREFGNLIKQLLLSARNTCPTSRLKTTLLAVFKEAIRKIRIIRDASARENLERHVKDQVLLVARDEFPSDPNVQHELDDKLTHVLRSKLTPAVESAPSGRAMGAFGAVGGTFAVGVGSATLPPPALTVPGGAGGSAFVTGVGTASGGAGGMTEYAAGAGMGAASGAPRVPFKNNVFDPIPNP